MAAKVKTTDLEHVDPATLVAWERNPRVNDHAVSAVARSIERFGFGAPIVARPSDRRVLAGHTRIKAAVKMGLATVPVRWLEIADGEADAYSLADNRWDDGTRGGEPALGAAVALAVVSSGRTA